VSEPKAQVEIQLGHMCNNRCVFCVSGQETALGRARPLPTEALRAELTRARERGHLKLTLLGGEPTLQPGFVELVAHAVALEFEEIVIFTNGVKTARASFIDQIIALGGNLTWRISIQGATREAHEQTTRKPGSFERIVRSLRQLRERGQRITINLCVVRSNFESVEHFPELLAPFGVSQLHLDMVRPLDAGQRSEAELAAMIPRYSELADPFRRMVRGFAPGFDVNIGNLPYCIAPDLAHVIHHDGEPTATIAVDGERDLSRPWDKYFVKRRDKLKPERCRSCVFDARCSGIFEKYRELYGDQELQPITQQRLRELDPELLLLGVHLGPVIDSLAGWQPAAPLSLTSAAVTGDRQARVELAAGSERLVVELGPPGAGVASFELFGLSVLERPAEAALARLGLDALWKRLADSGQRVLHPLGDDALRPATQPLAARIRRLRRSAPFGALAWTAVSFDAHGQRAELSLRGPQGEQAGVWLAEESGRVRGGYRLDGAPTPALIEGIGAVMHALRPG
jgi:MoaA/NifB/PqqE/SkfB family radical SAM enzyme